MADRRVFARAENVTFPTIRRVPSEPITLFRVTSQRNLRFDNIVNRVGSMFGAVENAHCARYSLCCEQIWVLGHVPRSVDFAFVID